MDGYGDVDVERKGGGLRTGRGCGGGEGGGHGEEGVEEMGYWVGMHGGFGEVVDGWMWMVGIVYVWVDVGGCVCMYGCLCMYVSMCVYVYGCLFVCRVDDSTNDG